MLVFTIVTMEVRVLQWFRVVFLGEAQRLQLPIVLLGPRAAPHLAQLVGPL
jgi:hypothetical protein